MHLSFNLTLSVLLAFCHFSYAGRYVYYTPLPRRSCNTPDPSPDLKATHEWLSDSEPAENGLWNSTMIQDHTALHHRQRARSISLTDFPDPYSNSTHDLLFRRQDTTIYLYTVNVWMHIVMATTDNDPSSKYYVTDSMITLQMNYLNNAYASTFINYNLIGVTRTINDTWASNGDDLAMKQSLRRGTYSTLNIYYQTHLRTNSNTQGIPAGSVLLGFCSLPSSGITPTTPTTLYIQDGCNILSGTLPGSYEGNYNKGGTTVHEVGHWNGLLHTFQGLGCGAGDYGDYVADTPQEGGSTSGCPAQKDSCPNSGVPSGSYSNMESTPYGPQGYSGPDPIHNFMDYSSDACYTGFTAGQGARMANLWVIYRQGK